MAVTCLAWPAGAQEVKRIRLLAGGDVAFTSDINREIDANQFDPFADLNGLLASADVAFVNLESVLASSNLPRARGRHRVPALRGTPSAAKILAQAGIDVVSVANNHVFDVGTAGLGESLSVLRAAGIAPCGAGLSTDEAFAPAIVNVGNKKVGFISFAFGVNHNPTPPGVYANFHDDPVGRLRALKSSVDVAVVSIHWGDEYQNQPADYQVRLAHRLVEAGADAIIAHHPHVLQGMEAWNGRPIFYSLGNFMWGKQLARREATAMVDLQFDPAGMAEPQVRVFPVYMKPPFGMPHVVGLQEGEAIVRDIKTFSRRFHTQWVEQGDALEMRMVQGESR
jgi:poly-gamma-glutamate synthesis protein (capsule biosynthesis protein)